MTAIFYPIVLSGVGLCLAYPVSATAAHESSHREAMEANQVPNKDSTRDNIVVSRKGDFKINRGDRLCFIAHISNEVDFSYRRDSGLSPLSSSGINSPAYKAFSEALRSKGFPRYNERGAPLLRSVNDQRQLLKCTKDHDAITIKTDVENTPKGDAYRVSIRVFKNGEGYTFYIDRDAIKERKRVNYKYYDQNNNYVSIIPNPYIFDVSSDVYNVSKKMLDFLI